MGGGGGGGGGGAEQLMEVIEQLQHIKKQSAESTSPFAFQYCQLLPSEILYQQQHFKSTTSIHIN